MYFVLLWSVYTENTVSEKQMILMQERSDLKDEHLTFDLVGFVGNNTEQIIHHTLKLKAQKNIYSLL